VFGGIYVDYDIECINPVCKVIDYGATAFVSRNSKFHFGDKSVRWSVIGCTFKHDLISTALQKVENIFREFPKKIEKCSSTIGRKIFKVLENSLRHHYHRVVMLDSNAIVDFDKSVPFAGTFTIGIYRSPRKHHYEKWFHCWVRKINMWSDRQPFASRILSYFILGLIMGIFMNFVVYFLRNALDKRFKKNTVVINK